MRAFFGLALAFLLAVTVGCAVPLTGAPCDDDSNCPSGQSCSAAKTCEVGTAAPGPDAGPSCVSDPACTGAATSVCDASGKVATCEVVSPGCRKPKNAVACATGKICQAGACRCSSGCAKGETACSAATGKLQTCDVAAGAECGTFVETACDSGLVCTSANGPARCVCAAPSPEGHLYVDPASAQPELEPSGALTPASCRFPRLTDALTKATSGTLVTLGADSAPSTATVLDQESFPLAVPAGVRVAAAGCPGVPCDPSKWIVSVGTGATGSAAMTLGADSVIVGVTLKYAGATSAAFVSCDTGSVILEDVGLVGSDDTTAKAAMGLLVSGACKPALSRVKASLFAGAGMSVDGADADLTVVGGGVQSSAVGLEIGRGSATVAPGNDQDDATRASFTENTVGIRVGKDGSSDAATLGASKPLLSKNGTGLGLGNAAAKATLSGASIADSTGKGIEAKGGELTLAGGTISNGDTGLFVDGAIVVATDAVISGQSGNGIEVASTARDVILTRVRVTSTRAAGIKHSSGALAIFDSEIDGHIDDGVKVLGGTVELANTRIHGNGVYGVSIAGAEANVRESDFYANGNKNAGGGLGFVGEGASLGLFYSNKLHGNFRAQLYVGVAPAAGTSWKISSTTCSSTINKVYCYATDAFGLLVEPSVTVAANNVSWMHSPPTTADKDYQGTVTFSPATAYCSVTACP
ncbi:MAG TPA: right-handed parallel beta-helix repeat-containing protein [Myxococcales bacterium]|jgi:hypothetical protein